MEPGSQKSLMSLCSCAPGWHGALYQRSGNRKHKVSGNAEIGRGENDLRKWFHQQWLIPSLNACLLPEGGTDSVGEAGSVQNHSLPEPGWLRFMSKQEAGPDGRMHPTVGRYLVTVNIHVEHTVGTDSWHCYHHSLLLSCCLHFYTRGSGACPPQHFRCF